jgi:hypothetical protein
MSQEDFFMFKVFSSKKKYHIAFILMGGYLSLILVNKEITARLGEKAWRLLRTMKKSYG